ncbi:Uncharacterised protein [uncultured archaeon]|nr:Uncharacterised protein [uncultured archaeon]
MDRKTIAIAILAAAVLLLVLAGLSHASMANGTCEENGFTRLLSGLPLGGDYYLVNDYSGGISFGGLYSFHITNTSYGANSIQINRGLTMFPNGSSIGGSRSILLPNGDNATIFVCSDNADLSQVYAKAVVQPKVNGSSANTSEPAGCASIPEITLAPASLSLPQGGVGTVKLQVRATQPVSCGRQLYGVDFTTAYDAGLFSLGISGVNGTNKFYLWPGEAREFDGLVGASEAIYSGNFTLQATAYNDADHWKQASKTFKVQVSPGNAGAAYWKTNLAVGWNAIPYMQGAGVYGCPEITEAYSYLPGQKEYVRLQRYGPIFALSPTGSYAVPERLGGLFVFSKGRCAMESRLEATEFSGAPIQLYNGQLLSVPLPWNGTALSSISNACALQSAYNKAEASRWDADRQVWVVLSHSDKLESGTAYRISSSDVCTLDSGSKPG